MSIMRSICRYSKKKFAEMIAEAGYGFDELRAAMISPVILEVNIPIQKRDLQSRMHRH